MKKIICSLFCVLLSCEVLALERPDLARYEVTADRVNLRVRADDHSEVVGQAAYGDLLSGKSVADGWLEIVMPQSLDAWVHREFIENNLVVPAKLNVRGGPGINYQVVGRIERGTRVVPRGELGEWMKIQPPASASLWISSDYVRKIPAPGEAVANQPAVKPPPVAPVARPIRLPEGPSVRPVQPKAIRRDLSVNEKALSPPEHLTLVPLPGQGRQKEMSGVLLKTGFLFGRPADFRLVSSRGDFQDTLCYVHADKEKMKPFLGYFVKISGHEYWYEGGRVPVIVVRDIEASRLGGGR